MTSLGDSRAGCALAPLAVAAILFAPGVFAQNPDDATPPCRAQVKTALDQIAPLYAGKTRKVTAKSPGSIEAAIWGYAPPRFHDVNEGSLPVMKAGAKCPSEMALIGGRFCVDCY